MNAHDRRKTTPVIPSDELLARINADIAKWNARLERRVRAYEPLWMFGATLEDLAGLLVLQTYADLVRSYANRNCRITNEDLDYYRRTACIVCATIQPILLVGSGAAGGRLSDEVFAERVYDWWFEWSYGYGPEHIEDYLLDLKDMGATEQHVRVDAVSRVFARIHDQIYTNFEVMWRTAMAIVGSGPTISPGADEAERRAEVVSEVFTALSPPGPESRLMWINSEGLIDLGGSQLRDAIVKPAVLRESRDAEHRHALIADGEGAVEPDIDPIDVAQALEVLKSELRDPIERGVADRILDLTSGVVTAARLASDLGVSEATLSRVRVALGERLKRLL